MPNEITLPPTQRRHIFIRRAHPRRRPPTKGIAVSCTLYQQHTWMFDMVQDEFRCPCGAKYRAGKVEHGPQA